MNLPPYAKLASRLLAQDEPSHLPPPSAEARREAIAAMEAALTAQSNRRSVVRGVAIGAAAAAAASLLLLLWPNTSRNPAPSARGEGAEVAVVALPLGAGARSADGRALSPDGTPLVPGARVQALPRGRALLRFSTGSRVTLDEGGELGLLAVADSQELALVRGALRADVAKLGPNKRFVVRTDDAEVVVHGTSFRVATVEPDPACGGGTRTRVEVYEGVVSVRVGEREVRVAAGDAFPHCDSAPSLTTTAPPVAATETAPSPAAPRAAPAPRPSRPLAPTPSELRAQNDLFLQAAASRRAGDVAAAIATLDLLLVRYPESPLAEDAAAERMKLLHKRDRAQAVRAAHAYLARHPEGFARAEAEAILGSAE